jgi:hypothetical protein
VDEVGGYGTASLGVLFLNILRPYVGVSKRQGTKYLLAQCHIPEELMPHYSKYVFKRQELDRYFQPILMLL